MKIDPRTFIIDLSERLVLLRAIDTRLKEVKVKYDRKFASKSAKTYKVSREIEHLENEYAALVDLRSGLRGDV